MQYYQENLRTPHQSTEWAPYLKTNLKMLRTHMMQHTICNIYFATHEFCNTNTATAKCTFYHTIFNTFFAAFTLQHVPYVTTCTFQMCVHLKDLLCHSLSELLTKMKFSVPETLSLSFSIFQSLSLSLSDSVLQSQSLNTSLFYL